MHIKVMFMIVILASFLEYGVSASAQNHFFKHNLDVIKMPLEEEHVSNEYDSTEEAPVIPKATTKDVEVWIWPMDDYVPVICGYLCYPNHHAIDLYDVVGSKVYAVRDGKVIKTNTLCPAVESRALECGGGYGNYVTIQHDNGTYSRYAHLDNVRISVGETVRGGEVIGTIGTSGRVGAPHLHFEIRENNLGMAYGGFDPLDPIHFQYKLPREIKNTKTGWVKDKNKWYYYVNGMKQVGWIEENGDYYFLNAKGVKQVGWLKDEGHTYFLNKDGIRQSGWVSEKGNLYYFDQYGVMVTGWLHDELGTYYLNKKGKALKGWKKINEHTYFFHPSGLMASDTIIDDVILDSSGVGSKISSDMLGWINVGSHRYYNTKKGLVKSKWIEIDDQLYYFHETGRLAINTKIDGKTIDEFGVARKSDELDGWVKNGHLDYYYEDGKRVTGWMTIDENKYYFNVNGSKMCDVWVNKREGAYYLNHEGIMVTGWQDYQHQKYYFKEDGLLLKNSNIEGWIISSSGMAYREGFINANYVVNGSKARLIKLGYKFDPALNVDNAMEMTINGTPGYEEALTESIVVTIIESNYKHFNVYVNDNTAYIYYK